MESSTNGKKMFYFFLLFCFLSLSPNQQVAGHCCLPSKYNEQCGTIITLFFYCNDCSIAFPYCEGPGGCNIFGKFFVCCDTFFISFSVHFFNFLLLGCNCDGPCRWGTTRLAVVGRQINFLKLNIDSWGLYDIFYVIDKRFFVNKNYISLG